jgi:hypothetical protein
VRLHADDVSSHHGAREPVAGLRAEAIAQRATAAEGVDLVALGVHLGDPQSTDAVPRPLAHVHDDVDEAAVGRELHPGLRDLDGEVAAVVVGRVQQVDVVAKGLFAKVPRRGEEREEVRGRGRHHPAQVAVGDAVVPDEPDGAHLHLRALHDAEHHVDLVALPPGGLHPVGDLGEEEALLGVEVDDLLHVAPQGELRQHRAVAEVDGLAELVLVDLVVALEAHGVDARALLQREHHGHAALGVVGAHGHVAKEPEVPQRAGVALRAGAVEAVADVGAHRVGELLFVHPHEAHVAHADHPSAGAHRGDVVLHLRGLGLSACVPLPRAGVVSATRIGGFDGGLHGLYRRGGLHHRRGQRGRLKLPAEQAATGLRAGPRRGEQHNRGPQRDEA